MNFDQATTIINMAGDQLPEFEDERIALGIQIANEAQEAYDDGARGESVKEILNFLSSIEKEFDIVIDVPAPLEMKPNVVLDTPKLGNIHEAKEKALAKIKKERLPIPNEIEGEPPSLPKDISLLGNSELRSLHSQFNACLARTNWLLALEESDELSAKHVLSYEITKYIKEHSGEINEATSKHKSLATLTEEADLDDTVKEWRQKYLIHSVEVRILKTLSEIYESNCTRASREFTMRAEERQSGI